MDGGFNVEANIPALATWLEYDSLVRVSLAMSNAPTRSGTLPRTRSPGYSLRRLLSECHVCRLAACLMNTSARS